MTITAGGVRRAGRPRRLSADQVLDAALALIDEVGVDGLTMEQLAASLGVGTSTVYGYVTTKQDLVDEVFDRVMSTLEVTDVAGTDWRRAAEAFAVGFRAVLIAHPNLAPRWTAREVMTPRAVENARRLIEAMAAGGMSVEAATAAYFTLSNFTVGQVLWELPRLHAHTSREYGRRMRAAGAAGGWEPDLLLGVSDYVAGTSAEEHFIRGLRLVIAGIESQRGCGITDRERLV